MLGYGDGTFTRESQFGMAPGGNFGMDDVKCSGSESDIRDCRHTTRDDCGPEEAAGAICSNFLGSNPDSSATPEGEYTEYIEYIPSQYLLLHQLFGLLHQKPRTCETSS